MKSHHMGMLVAALTFGSLSAWAVSPDYAATVLGRQKDSSGPISVTATFNIKDGKQADFEKLLARMKTRCQSEPGNQAFFVAQPLESTTRYTVYTVWETVADLKLHMDPKTNADYKKAVGELVNGNPLEAIDVTMFSEFK